MRVARFETGRRVCWGFVEHDTLLDATSLAGSDLHEALGGGLDHLRSIRDRLGPGDSVPISEAKLLAPLTRPSSIIGVGLNYRDHAEESGYPVPDRPITFAKLASAIIGPGDEIRLPPESLQVDWEAELALVIGPRARRVHADQALDHVIGYTIVNDVSARDIQVADGQWMRAKSFDTFAPIGPWITTMDELGDASGLGIRLFVNDEIKQSSNTSNLVAGVRCLVEYCSAASTLQPGDIITTGTAGGVGHARNPPEYLRPGDVVRIEIEGIGTLENPVTTEAP